MKKPVPKPHQRPVARPTLAITREQLALLLESMPEPYRGLVRDAVENKTPLSAHALPAATRYLVLRAFKKAREAIALPEMIFHDLTRATVS